MIVITRVLLIMFLLITSVEAKPLELVDALKQPSPAIITLSHPLTGRLSTVYPRQANREVTTVCTFELLLSLGDKTEYINPFTDKPGFASGDILLVNNGYNFHDATKQNIGVLISSQLATFQRTLPTSSQILSAKTVYELNQLLKDNNTPFPIDVTGTPWGVMKHKQWNVFTLVDPRAIKVLSVSCDLLYLRSNAEPEILQMKIRQGYFIESKT